MKNLLLENEFEFQYTWWHGIALMFPIKSGQLNHRCVCLFGLVSLLERSPVRQ